MDKLVLQAIQKRKITGNKHDGRKIGLIFEGGGMRAVFASGVACGLESLGFRDCFDIIYGSSAGSCVAGYFLAGNIEEGTSIFYEDLNNFKFIKPWRVQSMMDIEHMGNIFRNSSKRLNEQAIRKSGTEVRIYASEYKTGHTRAFTERDDTSLVDAILASTSAAGYSNKPIRVGDDIYLDGNLDKKLPIDEAIKDGCTDVLVVTTVPESYTESDKSALNLLKPLLMARLTKEYKQAYKRRTPIYNKNLDIVFGREVAPGSVRIYTIAPEGLTSVAERRSGKLRAAYMAGKNKVKKVFETEAR